MLIASIAPVTSLVSAGRPSRLNGDSRPLPTSEASADRSSLPLTGSGRSLLDPATQLAAQEFAGHRAGSNRNDLTDEQEAEVRELRKTDGEVRRHEQAHAMVGGPYAGAPRYEYVRGPDGQMYAVGGEVSIDTSPANSAEATIRKMDTVIRAALAPADPSAQDHAVAAQARKARAEAVAEKRAETSAESGSADPVATASVPADPPRESEKPPVTDVSDAAAAEAAQRSALRAADAERAFVDDLEKSRLRDRADARAAYFERVADRATTLYQRIAGLADPPLDLVTPSSSIELVA